MVLKKGNFSTYILNYEVLNYQLNHIWWNNKNSSEQYFLKLYLFHIFDQVSPWVKTKLDIFKESPFMMSLQLLEIDFNILYVVTATIIQVIQ